MIDEEILEHLKKDVPGTFAFVLFIDKGNNVTTTRGCSGDKGMIEFLGLIELAKNDALAVIDGRLENRGRFK